MFLKKQNSAITLVVPSLITTLVAGGLWCFEQSSQLGTALGCIVFTALSLVVLHQSLIYYISVSIGLGLLSSGVIHIDTLPMLLRLYLTEIFSIACYLSVLYGLLLCIKHYLETVSKFFELSLLAYTAHHFVWINAIHPTRPLWFMDWCIEYEIDPQLIFSCTASLLIVVWSLRFLSTLNQNKSWFFAGLFMLIIGFANPISLLLPNNVTGANQVKEPPKEDQQNKSNAKKRTKEKKKNKSSSKQQSQSNQPVAFLRFYGYHRVSKRLQALYISDQICNDLGVNIDDDQLGVKCSKQAVSYVEDPTDAEIDWERFDLSEQINTKLWRFQGEIKAPQEQEISPNQIHRAFRGKTRFPSTDLRFTSFQSLSLNSVKPLKVAEDSAEEQTSSSPKSIPADSVKTASKDLIKGLKTQVPRYVFSAEDQALLKTKQLSTEQRQLIKPIFKKLYSSLESYELEMDPLKLKKVMEHFADWKITESAAKNFDPKQACTIQQGPNLHRLRCALLSIRAFGISARLVGGYRIPIKQNQYLSEHLVTRQNQTHWLEVFVESSSAKAIGWRVVGIPLNSSENNAQDMNEHELKQLISHWIDEAKKREDSLDKSAHTQETFLWMGILAISLLLLLSIFDRLIMLCLRAFGNPNHIYSYALVHLYYFGLKRQYGESRTQFVNRVKDKLPSCIGDVFEELTLMYMQRNLDANQRKLMRRFAKKLAKANTQQLLEQAIRKFHIQSLLMTKIDLPKQNDQAIGKTP